MMTRHTRELLVGQCFDGCQRELNAEVLAVASFDHHELGRTGVHGVLAGSRIASGIFALQRHVSVACLHLIGSHDQE